VRLGVSAGRWERSAVRGKVPTVWWAKAGVRGNDLTGRATASAVWIICGSMPLRGSPKPNS
jgi:hypothetical protein